MWNFLFLVFTPISQRNRRGRGGGGGGRLCWSGLFSKYRDLFALTAFYPHLPPPTSTTSSRFHQPCICCPVSIRERWRSKSVHSLLFFCNGLETAKCRGLWYLRAHKSGLPYCLPSQPAPQPHWIPSVPLTSAHAAPILSPDLLSLTWMCVTVSSSNASSPNGSSPFQSSERRI